MAALAYNPIPIGGKEFLACNPSRGEAELFNKIADTQLERVRRIYGDKLKVKLCRKVCSAIEHPNGVLDLTVPKPTSVLKLRNFVHECQHAILGHSSHSFNNTFPLSTMEYEAEQATFKILESNGIGITPQIHTYSKQYVAAAVGYDIKHKVKPDQRAIRYAKTYLGSKKVVDALDRLQKSEASAAMNPNPDIHPGDFVKIIRGSERFWVRYTGKSDGKAHGVVDNELLNTSIHGLKRGSKVAFRSGEVIDVVKGNPAVSAEQYRLAQAVLSGTARDTHMPVSVAREIVGRTPARLRSEYSKNPVYGMDLDLETTMAPAWKYYDSKAARDAHARLKEGEGQKVVLGHSMFGFKEGGGKKWRMRLADHRGNPKKRPNDVDGNPVPQNYDVVSIRRNSGDALDVKNGLAVGNIPSVIVEPGTTTFGQSTGSWTVWTPKKTYKRAVKLAEKAYFDRYPERMQNPQPAADNMYASFHGEPSDETIEIADEEHYHSHLAALGELVELKVKLVNGGTAVIGFETGAGDEEENPKQKWLLPFKRGKKNYEDVGYLPYALQHDIGFGGDKMYRPVKYENGQITVMSSELSDAHYDRYSRKSAIDAVKYLAAGMGKQNPSTDNPFWPFNSFTHTTIYHVGTGEKYKKSGSYKGYTLYKKLDTDEFLVPALDKDSRFDTLKDVKAFVDSWTKHSKNPGPFHEAGKLIGRGTRAARKPMNDFIGAAGKVGGYLDDELGRALNPQREYKTEASFKKALAKATVDGSLVNWYGTDHGWVIVTRKMVKNPSGRDTGPAYLTANEDGTQLFIVGGDQSLDLPGLGITGPQADKELVTIGQVTNVVYHAHKIFNGKREEYDYTHKLSEDTHGPLPVLVYDRINQQLKLSGGVYHIPRPMIGTSPGITD